MLCYLTEVVVTSAIFLTDKNCQTWYSRPIVLLYLSIEHRERPVQCASLGLSSPTLVVSAGL